MLIFRILLGLFGLGIVVFVHELGHFIACPPYGNQSGGVFNRLG